MKYITKSNSISSKITGFVAIVFLLLGIFSIYFEPTILFGWVWTLFMFVAFSLWCFSYIKGHQWIFEVTSSHICFQSPFAPKLTVKVSLQNITEIRLFDGDITSGKIIMTNSETINIPPPCLPKLNEIAKSIKNVGVTVFLNNTPFE